jgi:hypothetical protein
MLRTNGVRANRVQARHLLVAKWKTSFLNVGTLSAKPSALRFFILAGTAGNLFS